MDTVKKIAVIKNESNKNIVVVHTTDSISDNVLFYGNKLSIKPNSIEEFWDGSAIIGNDSLVYFYIFDSDSINKFVSKDTKSGIVVNCLLAKHSVSVDNLKKNNTIVYK